MKQVSFSFFLLVLTFALVHVPKLTLTSAIQDIPFKVDEACKGSNIVNKCASLLKSLGGDDEKVKACKFSDKVVKHTQSEFGKVSTKARKEMREDKAKVEVKKALSHCVKLYLDMNNELRGLMAVGLKTSNYGTTVDKFSNMAHNYPRLCEEGLKHVGTSGQDFGFYDNYKELEDLGDIVTVVTRYVSANFSHKEGQEKSSSNDKQKKNASNEKQENNNVSNEKQEKNISNKKQEKNASNEKQN